MSAPKSFSTSARRAAGLQKPLEFFIEKTDDNGNPIARYDFQAQYPTQDQMVLFALIDFEDEEDVRHSLQVLFDFLGGVVGADGRRRLEKALGRGHVEMETLVGGEDSLLGWLLGEWGSFPTQPSSDSSPAPVQTGKRSTGRQRRPESTPSPSLSIDS